jgi:hypothetical protein
VPLLGLVAWSGPNTPTPQLEVESFSLPAWEPHVTSKATQAQSFERRWRRFLTNKKINTEHIYLPLVMAALSKWKNQRLSLAIDITVLWDKYCMIHLSVVCCGRAIPLLWDVLEHESATVAFSDYERLDGCCVDIQMWFS